MNHRHITIQPHRDPHPELFRTFTVTFYSTPITTIVTANPFVVIDWLIAVRTRIHTPLTQYRVVGLGVQWNPISIFEPPPAATLQLCVERQCLIFQLLYVRTVPYCLRRFLEDRSNTFVGVWNHFDRDLLYRSFHGLSVSRLVDARLVAADRYRLSNQLSMENLAQIFLGAHGFNRPESISISNWEASLLSPEQIQFACVDAYVSSELGKAMQVWNWNQ